jgi:hypothetical protein
MVLRPGQLYCQTVDNCHKTVDKPRGLWKSRSIVRFYTPHIWQVFLSQPKIWMLQKNCPTGPRKAFFFYQFSPQGLKLFLFEITQYLVPGTPHGHIWGL